MTVSIAELNSRVCLGLKSAAEYLELDDVHNAVVNHVNVRTQFSRVSSINVLLSRSSEFTPTSSPYDITSLIGKGVPMFVETRADVLENAGWWRPIRVVPLVQLTEYAQMGTLACAFEGREPDGDTTTDGEQATGTLTVAGVAVAGETLTVNGIEFVFVAEGTQSDDPYEIVFVTNANVTAANIAAALNACSDAAVAAATYAAEDNVVTITYRTVGAAGNAFTIENSSYDAVTVEADTLTDGSDATNGAATQYLHFTFVPAAPCRIRYDRDAERIRLANDVLLPDDLSELPVMDAQISLIPKIKVEIANRVIRDPKLADVSKLLMSALDDQKAQLELDLRSLVALWEVWAFRDRDVSTSFTKPTPTGRAMYGSPFIGGPGNTGDSY